MRGLRRVKSTKFFFIFFILIFVLIFGVALALSEKSSIRVVGFVLSVLSVTGLFVSYYFYGRK